MTRARRDATRRAALLVAALLAAGCAGPPPRYERPAPPVPERFPETAPDAAAAPAAADIPWPQFFTEPRLQRSIGLALRNNRDLRLAVLAIEQARAQAALRDADLWPTLSVGLGGSRQPVGTGVANTVYSAGFTVAAYEVDLFGRLKNLDDAAAAQLLASAQARDAVQISLVASVANTWLALRADDELLRVTRETLASRDESLRLVRLRFEHGASSLLDLRQAESLRESARVSLAQLLRQRAGDENAIALLLGLPLPADLAPADAELPSLPELPAGLPSEVLTRRPDVRQAELQLVAANANIGAARAAFFPRITLTGSVGRASSQLSGLFKGGSFAWGFAPQLLQPIFDGGRNRANLALAETNRDIAVAQYERAIQSAFREVADALASRATLDEQLQAQQALLRAEQGRVELSELRTRHGAASSLELLDAQRSLFAAQQALVQLQAQRVQNLVTLYRVLGGGWTAEPTVQ